MNDISLLLLSSMIICSISSAVLFDKLKWKPPVWKFTLLLFLNSMFIGGLGVFIFPAGKLIALIIDSLFLGFFLVHHRGRTLLEDVSFGILLGLCEFISIPIVLYLIQRVNNLPAINLQVNIVIMLCSQLIILCLYRLYKYTRKTEKESLPLFVHIFQVVVLPIFTIINLFFMVLLSAYYMLPSMLAMMMLDMIFVIFLNVYLFYLLDKMQENNRLRQQTVVLQETSKMQYSYYQRLEEKYQNSRQVLHDVKRHLQVLENIDLPKDNVFPYINDVKELMSHYTQEVYSQHPIVNVILYEKFEEAKKLAIAVDFRIAPVDFHFMKEIDITVIFANLLDNAIDACKEVQANRFIFLQIEQIQDFLVVFIKNSCAKKATITTSSKSGHEGFGLRNVAQTLEIYGGNMQVESNEHEFSIHLYIPMV